MKFKLKGYLTALLLGVSFVSSNTALSSEPKIKPADIVLPQPTEENMLATKRLTTRLTQSHYRKFQLDEEFSEKIFDRYLKNLDFSHNTFYQSDVDQMRSKYAKKLGEQLNQGILTAAFEMYDLMMKRRYERYKYALSLLDTEPNLKENDSIEIDREKAAWPKNEVEANELWAQRVKNDVINLKLKDKNGQKLKRN